MRILVWGLTLGLVGAALADYSSYDESGHTTILGGLIGALAGGVIGVLLEWRDRARKSS